MFLTYFEAKTRITTSINSEAIWNVKRYICLWTSENWKHKEIKYQPRSICFYIFTFLPFVAWLTDWYGKQKVEKESIKLNTTKNSKNYKIGRQVPIWLKRNN